MRIKNHLENFILLLVAVLVNAGTAVVAGVVTEGMPKLIKDNNIGRI